MGPPMEGADVVLRLLKDRGFKIVILTVRARDERGIRVVEDWLKYHMLPYDEVTNVKPQAIAYVDDRAVRFDTWGNVARQLGEIFAEEGVF